jgi:hypothetical protein
MEQYFFFFFFIIPFPGGRFACSSVSYGVVRCSCSSVSCVPSNGAFSSVQTSFYIFQFQTSRPPLNEHSAKKHAGELSYLAFG